MARKCNECRFYIKDKTENNCVKKMVGKINEEDSACYKIEESDKMNKELKNKQMNEL